MATQFWTMSKCHSWQTTNIMGEAQRIFINSQSQICNRVDCALHLYRISKAVNSPTLQTLPVMKVKNKPEHSNPMLALRDLIDRSVTFNWKYKRLLSQESAIMWTGIVPGFLLCPGGITDSPEVTWLLGLKLTCEGDHRSSWSLGTVIEWGKGFYFLQQNGPCLDNNTIPGWSDLDRSSLLKHFCLFCSFAKTSEVNMKFSLNFTKWIIVQINTILCRMKDRILNNYTLQMNYTCF